MFLAGQRLAVTGGRPGTPAPRNLQATDNGTTQPWIHRDAWIHCDASPQLLRPRDNLPATAAFVRLREPTCFLFGHRHLERSWTGLYTLPRRRRGRNPATTSQRRRRSSGSTNPRAPRSATGMCVQASYACLHLLHYTKLEASPPIHAMQLANNIKTI